MRARRNHRFACNSGFFGTSRNTNTKRCSNKTHPTQKIETHSTAKMARGSLQEKRTDRKLEEEEKDSEEEEDLKKNLSEANLDELFNIEEKPAKNVATSKKKVGNSNESAEGRAKVSAVSKSLPKIPRKALPNRIADGKPAKPKSNVAQLANWPRGDGAKLTSSVLQSEKKLSGNLKKAPGLLVTQNPKDASGPSQIAGNIQREQKQTNKKADVLDSKPKSTSAKRKQQEELPFTKRKKSEEDDDLFGKIFESVYSQDNLDIYLGEEVPTVDDLIEKAERTVWVLPDDLLQNNLPTEEDTQKMKRIVVYVATLAKAQQKAIEAGKEPRLKLPLWGTEKEGSLAILHALQNLNILLGDLLASIEMHESQDGNQIMQMLSIYVGKSKNAQKFVSNNH